jgi:plasmid stabilization system protein ParE
MNYLIIWEDLAEQSFIEEANFILTKWNLKEVEKFEILVENELERLSNNPTIGNISYKNIYSIVISKQTTIYYKIKSDSNLIELILFWNNLKNPNDLLKLV